MLDLGSVQRAVLYELWCRDGSQAGKDVGAALTARPDSVWGCASPSSVYAALRSLEWRGLVCSVWDTTGTRPLHMYTLTPAGKARALTLVTQAGLGMKGY